MTLIASGRYIGDLRGTAVANLFLEVNGPDQGGVRSFVVRVGLPSGVKIFRGTLANADDDGRTLDLVADNDGGAAKFVIEHVEHASFHGTWSDDGHGAGPFSFTRSRADHPSHAAGGGGQQVIQSLQRVGTLPRASVYKDDVVTWSEVMKGLLETPFEVNFRTKIGGKEVRRLGNDFWKITALPDEVAEIHLWLGEPGELPRSISISMSPTDCSYTVQGSSDLWVSGTFNELRELLQRRRGWLRTLYEKHFLNVNGILLFTVIALSPSIEDAFSRFIFVFGSLALMIAIAGAHKATTKVRVFLKSEFKRPVLFDLPRFLTAMAAGAALAAISWGYTILQSGELKLWLQQMLGPLP